MIKLLKCTWKVLFCWLALIVSTRGVAETIAPTHASAMLHLRDGDFIAGHLMDCSEPEVIRWQMRGATQPFDLQATAVRAMYFPAPAAEPAGDSKFVIELTDGDLLFGSLVDVTPEAFVIDSAGFGQLHIERNEIRRITSTGDVGGLEYRGPNGLADWTVSSPQQWRDEAGRLISNEPHAKVEKEITLPKRARVQFEIAWRDAPEFVMSFAAGSADEQFQEGFRFEVWQNALVAIRALGDHADVAIVCQLDAKDKRVQLDALIDQEQGTMIVCGPDGKQLAEIEVAPKFAKHGAALKQITIVNGRSELRLERLTVSRWSGQLPPKIEADKPGLLQVDGEVQYRSVVGYDAGAREFILRGPDDSEDKRIAVDQVACIFPAPSAVSSGYTYRVALHNGSQMSGQLSQIKNGIIYLERHGVESPVTCPVDQIRSLVANHRKAMTPQPLAGRMGRLELDNVQLHGSLIAGPADDDSKSFLVWQPRWSTTGSPIEPDVSGRIVYRDPPAPKPKPNSRAQQRAEQLRQLQRRRARPAGVWGQVLNVFAPSGDNPAKPPKSTGAGTLHMLSGDRLPYDSAEIDETGVHFKSSFVDASFVPHTEIKALELVPRWTAAALAEEKRQRLLTLPRMQKPNPPTHLIASTGGDYLRTRLTSMSADKLQVESRLETKQIPRDRVACIIWLHSDEAGGQQEPKPPVPEKPADRPRVQAACTDGSRLSFCPRECSGSELIGTSELLGPCRVALQAIDVLNIGGMIERSAEEQPFHDWKLADAIEPAYLHDDANADSGARPPAASGLIGKPAPDARLELLDGKPFQIADHKGQIVVLDFWASWCGPCMQAMPEVESVVGEYADQGVQLFAVNLQEDAATAKGAIERLKFGGTVVLDTDGALAEHYQVTAIPQTVVINAEGIVEQLFVGAGPNLPDELRATLDGLVKKEAAQ